MIFPVHLNHMISNDQMRNRRSIYVKIWSSTHNTIIINVNKQHHFIAYCLTFLFYTIKWFWSSKFCQEVMLIIYQLHELCVSLLSYINSKYRYSSDLMSPLKVSILKRVGTLRRISNRFIVISYIYRNSFYASVFLPKTIKPMVN